MHINFHTIAKIVFFLVLMPHYLFSAITLPSKSEEAILYQNAEDAMRSGNILAAEEHYGALWERILKQKRVLGNTQTKLQDNLFKDVAVRYISILNQNRQQEKVKKIVQQMMELFTPQSIVEIYYEKAKILCSDNKPNDAFILLDNYKTHLNFKEWPVKVQSFYKALEFSLNEYYKKRLKDAESHFSMGEDKKAEEALNEVAQAVQKGLFLTIQKTE